MTHQIRTVGGESWSGVGHERRYHGLQMSTIVNQHRTLRDLDDADDLRHDSESDYLFSRWLNIVKRYKNVVPRIAETEFDTSVLARRMGWSGWPVEAIMSFENHKVREFSHTRWLSAARICEEMLKEITYLCTLMELKKVRTYPSFSTGATASKGRGRGQNLARYLHYLPNAYTPFNPNQQEAGMVHICDPLVANINEDQVAQKILTLQADLSAWFKMSFYVTPKPQFPCLIRDTLRMDGVAAEILFNRQLLLYHPDDTGYEFAYHQNCRMFAVTADMMEQALPCPDITLFSPALNPDIVYASVMDKKRVKGGRIFSMLRNVRYINGKQPEFERGGKVEQNFAS